MALHDTDKNSEDRGAPTPNHSDVLPSEGVKAHKTISSHYSSDADTLPGLLQMQNKQVIANDGTTAVGLFGYNNAMKLWGLFQTKPGTDVTTNTDPSKFIFNSSQDVFKIVTSGTLNFGVQAINTIVDQTVTHNLGYTPAFQVYQTSGSTYFQVPFTSINMATGTVSTQISAIADSTNLVVTVYNSNVSTGTAGPITVKYYLLQETAN